MRWPLVYLPDERLSAAELSAARLDGDLVEIGEGYMPADAIESTTARAASLRSICGTRLVACSWSAAWIYGVLPEPPHRHSMMRGVPHRVGNLIDRRVIFHDVGVERDDIAEVAGVMVTSPLRTLIDVSRRIREPEHRDRARDVVRGFISFGLVDPDVALARIDSPHRLPGARHARRELLRCISSVGSGPPAEPSQPVVTR